MDFSSMGTGTAWALFGAVGIACISAIVIVAIVAKYLRGYKRIGAGKFRIEKDGSVTAKKASLETEELERIAHIVASVIKKDLPHDCVRGPLIKALAENDIAIFTHGIAICNSAIDAGKADYQNGPVTRARDELTVRQDEFKTILTQEAIG